MLLGPEMQLQICSTSQFTFLFPVRKVEMKLSKDCLSGQLNYLTKFQRDVFQSSILTSTLDLGLITMAKSFPPMRWEITTCKKRRHLAPLFAGFSRDTTWYYHTLSEHTTAPIILPIKLVHPASLMVLLYPWHCSTVMQWLLMCGSKVAEHCNSFDQSI